MQHLVIKSMILANRRTLLSLCLGIPLGFFYQSANAAPLPKLAARTKDTNNTLTRAKALASQWSRGASELQPRLPALWDWANPTTLSQATSPSPQDLPKDAPASNSALNDAEQEAATILDEVTVTATRKPTRGRDTTATTYSVQKLDFDRIGARTVADALLLVPGFQSPPSLGGVNGFGQTFLRGFTQFDLLRDGLSLTRSQDSFSDSSRIGLEDIERIEVVSSAATLRYGAGSVGGVINLITETPKGSPKLTLKFETGSYGFSRYIAKYGGGDEIFSYNLIYTGLVAFNDYPFSLNVPNTALFYRPSDFTPTGIPLYGLLKPEVGSPATISGRADSAGNASDTYSAKLVFTPDPSNRFTLHLDQQNSKSGTFGPGNYAFGACRGGANGIPNGTLSGNRLLPVDTNGNELPCDQQRYIFRTPTTLFASRYAYNSSFNGSTIFPTGQAFLGAEPSTGTFDFFTQSFRTRTEASLQWDYKISPTTSLASYIYYNRFSQSQTTPPSFLYNTNILGTGSSGTAVLPISSFSYNVGDRYEAQTLLSSLLSPGQTLSFGINFTQEQFFQTLNSNSSFTDNAISRTSVFIIDDVSFGDLVKANVGLRYTSSSQFGEVLTPAAGIRITPSAWLSFRANYSQVYSPPSIGALYLSGLPFIANPNLRPESGATYDFGVDITPTKNISLRATYFNTYLDGVVGAVQFQNGDPLTSPIFPLLSQLRNLSSRRSSGIELETLWQATTELGFRLAWTNTDARNYGFADQVSQATYPFFYEYQDPYIPFNKVNFSLTYAVDAFSATLLGQYNSGYRRGTTNAPTTSGGSEFTSSFATLDLNLSLKVSQTLTVTAGVFNLTDAQYEYLPGIPAPGTTFRIGGKLEL
jgi:iron complex outermembrane recepter protein